MYTTDDNNDVKLAMRTRIHIYYNGSIIIIKSLIVSAALKTLQISILQTKYMYTFFITASEVLQDPVHKIFSKKAKVIKSSFA